DAVLGQQPDVRAASLQHWDVADRDAAYPLDRQHVRAAIVPMHLRHVERRGVRQVALQLRRLRGLAQQIDLVQQRLLEFLNGLDGPQPPRVRPVALREPGELVQDLDVALDQPAHVRAQDLDDDLAAVDERRRVHLRDRRGRERLALELCEDLRHRAMERALEHCERDVRREWRHLVLQLRELVRERRRQKIPAGRDRLAELHVDRAELLECKPQALAERPRLDRRARQELLDPGERPEEMRVPDDLVEPVAKQRPLDAEEPERQPQAAEHQRVSTSASAVRRRARSDRSSMRASARSTSSRSRSIASKSTSASLRVGSRRPSSVRYSAVSARSASSALAAHACADRAALAARCATTSPTHRESSSSGSGSAIRSSSANRSATCTRPVNVTPEPGKRLALGDVKTRSRSSGDPRTVASAASPPPRCNRTRPPSMRNTTSMP